MKLCARIHPRRLGATLVLATAAGLALAAASPAVRASALGPVTLPGLPLLPGPPASGAATAPPSGTGPGVAVSTGAGRTRLPGVDPAMLAGLPLDPLVRGLVSPPALDPIPPRAHPQQDLAAAIASFSRDLGVPRDPGPALASAHLSDRLAGMLAATVESLHRCDRLSNRLLADQPFRHGVEDQVPLAADAVRAIRSCALTVEQTALQLEAQLPTAVGADGPGALDVWPVVRVSGSPGTVYTNDYALVLDTGGHARFLNNAGGNLIDLKRGPQPFARMPGPARGCQEPYPDTVDGRVVRGPNGERQMSHDGPECVISAALVLAMGGNDQFGALTAPQFPDDNCTADPEESRIATAGSGTGGVGILIEHGDHNTYIGRAQALGAGHLGGVGMLIDQGAGDNTYLSVATSEGMGLLGGTGLLVDLGRHSTFDYYLPRPLNPLAKGEEDGAGGIVNDAGLFSEVHMGQHQSKKGTPDRQPGGVCDNVSRSLQGVGLLGGGVGMVLAAGGDNSFRAVEAPPDTFFIHDFNLENLFSVILSHCNQGCGLEGGVGALVDVHGGGYDRYLNDLRQPWATHHDGGVAGPEIRRQPDPGGIADLSQVTCSYFMDLHLPDGRSAARAPVTGGWVDRLRPGGIHSS
ncbi:MAG: hypothetical protein QOE72_4368 [Chloroflexota bacterium]|jgi:hypothetical protein|nr:hypothetical protein [Chloroflexota bacterium]